jgi:hypothetical protein
MPKIAEFLGTTVDALLEDDTVPTRIEDPDGIIFKRIWVEMSEKFITQLCLANFLDITESTVFGWRKGRSKTYCKLETLEKISELLCVDANFLITGETAPRMLDDEFKMDLILKELGEINATLRRIEVLVK